MSSQKAWAIIAGVGPGTGACIARRFAKEYSVALLARKPANFEPVVKEITTAGGKAIGIIADASEADSMKDALEKFQREMGSSPLAAAVFNVGGGMVRKPFLELSEEDMENGWKSNGLGSFHFAQAVLPLLLEHAQTASQHPPTLIFTSSTAATKGSAQFAAFAGGQFAKRAIVQSLAREYGPQGIHVVNAIIDGVIDIEKSKDYLTHHAEAKINPESIADTYWFLHTQPRTCFTNELDIRPAIEKW